jgi:hypothetical protein
MKGIDRRSFMSSIAALALPSSSATTPKRRTADDELVRLGQEFHQLAAKVDGLLGATTPGSNDDALISVLKAMGDLEAVIVMTPAESLFGLQVKARAALWAREGYLDPENEATLEQKMLWSLAEDLLVNISRWAQTKQFPINDLVGAYMFV